MAERIGTGKCCLCGGANAKFSLTSAGLVSFFCPDEPLGCNFQGFPRGDASDEKARALIAREPAPAVDPIAKPDDDETLPPPAPRPADPPAPKVEAGDLWDYMK